MARSSNTKRRRDLQTPITSRRLPVSYTPNPVNVTSLLRQIEDRRQYHPTRYTRPAASFNQSRHRLAISSQPARLKTPLNNDPFAKLRRLGSYVTNGVRFTAPHKVLICVRRKIRKEIMFARKKAGKRGQRRPRFNQYSKISCRRK